MTTVQVCVCVCLCSVYVYMKVAFVWVLNGDGILAKNRPDHTHIIPRFLTPAASRKLFDIRM